MDLVRLRSTPGPLAAKGDVSTVDSTATSTVPSSPIRPLQTPAPEARALVEGPQGRPPSGPPPSFPVGGSMAHFVDILRVKVDLVLDASSGEARVEAEVELKLPFDGLPILDLDQDIDALSVNGEALDPKRLSRVRDPDDQSEVRVLTKPMRAGVHQVRIGYDLKSPHLKLGRGRVELFQKATDLTPGYSEMFFPSNLQYDRYPLDMQVQVRGARRPPTLFTNGAVREEGPGHWNIEFPPHFNTTSFYLHVTDPERHVVVEETVQGVERPIPIKVYGDNPRTVKKAVETIRATIAELEADYGPYDHPDFVAWVLDDYPGGMEYNGATVTSPDALEHEIFHSWFARGVMPAGGDAGWFDEALARWRDRGYPRADAVRFGRRRYPQLTDHSPWARVTQRDSYRHGSDVLSEVDLLLAPTGGLKPVLRDLYATYKKQTIDTDTFLGFILERAPEEARSTLRRLFDVKLRGRPDPGPRTADAPPDLTHI